MRSLVLWAEPTSTNLGVRALAAGTTRLLEQTFPGVEVAYQGYGAGDAPVRIGAPRGHLKRLVVPDELIDWLREFDLVVDTRAGDSFADIYGLRRLVTMSLMGEAVHRAGTPLVFGPQTIGPFGTRRGRWVGARSLRHARGVLARDPESAECAAQLGRGVDVLTTDVVFALDRVSAAQSRDVVVNPSGLLWAAGDHVDPAFYRELLTDLCRQLQRSGRTVTLLTHVLESSLADKDLPAAEDLAERLDQDVEILVPQDLAHVRELLATATVVVGSRMHACLNALSLGRPAVALAYSRKFQPLLGNLGWPHTIDLRSGGDHLARIIAAVDSPSLERDVRDVRDRADQLLGPARAALLSAAHAARGKHAQT